MVPGLKSIAAVHRINCKDNFCLPQDVTIIGNFLLHLVIFAGILLALWLQLRYHRPSASGARVSRPERTRRGQFKRETKRDRCSRFEIAPSRRQRRARECEGEGVGGGGARDVQLGRGAPFPERPPMVRDRAKQTANYPDNTGEGGKRRVNETLIRSRFESFGSPVLWSELKDCCSIRSSVLAECRRRSYDTRQSPKPLLQENYASPPPPPFVFLFHHHTGLSDWQGPVSKYPLKPKEGHRESRRPKSLPAQAPNGLSRDIMFMQIKVIL